MKEMLMILPIAVFGFISELKGNENAKELFNYNSFVHFVMIEGVKTGYNIPTEFVTQGGPWNEKVAAFNYELIVAKSKAELNRKYEKNWKLENIFANSKSSNLEHGYFVLRWSAGREYWYDVAVNARGDIFPIGKSFDLFDGLRDLMPADFGFDVDEMFPEVVRARILIDEDRLVATKWELGEPLLIDKEIKQSALGKLQKKTGVNWIFLNTILINVDDKDGWVVVISFINKDLDELAGFKVYTDFSGESAIFDKTEFNPVL